jgi:hypothetical protein
MLRKYAGLLTFALGLDRPLIASAAVRGDAKDATTVANANAYTSGSVFTVKPIRRDKDHRLEVVQGLVDTPNYEPWYHLAVVQFKDDGSPTESRQTDAAVAAIQEGRRASAYGAIVVVFIHGWHHNAAWRRTPSTDAADNDGDAHFHGFRLILESLARREMERTHWRRVVGVYVSWNGDPVGGLRGLISATPLTFTSFEDRYPVAERIGAGTAFETTLRRLITATKDGTLSGNHAASPLVMIGHSMGALMLESGLLAILTSSQPLILQSSAPRGTVILTSEQGPVSFPDLILALNSAADSRIAKSIRDALQARKLEKTASGTTPAGVAVRYSPPILMSVTSQGDTATRDWWPRAKRLYGGSGRTDGHDTALFTHDFTKTVPASICRKLPGFRDFGQNWHCLRTPRPPVGAMPSISVDLPVRERTGPADDQVPHARYTLSPRGSGSAPSLLWVFQVPVDVIEEHNEIFTSKARSLTLALIQVSGAVASLAGEWAESFEPE